MGHAAHRGMPRFFQAQTSRAVGVYPSRTRLRALRYAEAGKAGWIHAKGCIPTTLVTTNHCMPILGKNGKFGNFSLGKVCRIGNFSKETVDKRCKIVQDGRHGKT